MNKVQPIPKGYYNTLTPYINVKGASEAIEFYKKAFGAKENGSMSKTPRTKVRKSVFEHLKNASYF